MVEHIQAIRGKNVVAVIDFLETTIYPTDASPGQVPVGHGRGKANASHQWVAHVDKHRPDVAAKVVADVRVDIDHLDDRQVLRLAQYYFGAPLIRDSGDSRSGEQIGTKA